VLRLLHSLFFSEVLHLRLTSGRLAAHTRAGITKMDTVPIKTDCSRQRVGTLVSKRDRLFVSFRARDLRLVSRFQLQDAPFCCRSACVLSGGGFTRRVPSRAGHVLHFVSQLPACSTFGASPSPTVGQGSFHRIVMTFGSPSNPTPQRLDTLLTLSRALRCVFYFRMPLFTSSTCVLSMGLYA
jgi:hypothetical protein